MALERSNPIPAGVYWIDAFGSAGVEAFRKWARTWGEYSATIIRDEPIGSDPASRPTVESGRWFLFQITAGNAVPRWTTSTGLGLPTRATLETRQADIVQRPPPTTPGDILGEAVGAIPSPLTTLAIGVGVGVGLILMIRLFK